MQRWPQHFTECQSKECHSEEWHSGEWHSGEWHSGEWHSGEWHSGECHSEECHSEEWQSEECHSEEWHSEECYSEECHSEEWHSEEWYSEECDSNPIKDTSSSVVLLNVVAPQQSLSFPQVSETFETFMFRKVIWKTQAMQTDYLIKNFVQKKSRGYLSKLIFS